VNVDFVALWGFVVDDCLDTFDIETTRGEISGKKEVSLAVSEAFNGFDTLRI
jgi:hypothetical protein